MGSLAQALETTALTRGNVCGVIKALQAISDDEDRELLTEWLAHPSTPEHAHVARACVSIGVKLSANTVSRHRSGQCSCGPTR